MAQVQFQLLHQSPPVSPISFNSASSTYLAFTRPVQDDFTIICAFQSTQGLDSGTLFYEGAGLVNGEVGGVVDDFGTCLFADGSICAGTGNPDVAAVSGGGYNDGNPHVMSFTRQRSSGSLSSRPPTCSTTASPRRREPRSAT